MVMNSTLLLANNNAFFHQNERSANVDDYEIIIKSDNPNQYPLTTFRGATKLEGTLQQSPFQTVLAGHLTHVLPYSK